MPRPPTSRTLVPSLALTLVLFGCNGADDTGDDDAAASPEAGEEAGEDGEVDCPTLDVDPVALVGDDAAAVSRSLAGATDACAATVVVADGSDPVAAAIAVPLASGSDAPLLLDDDPAATDEAVAALSRDGEEPEVIRVAVPTDTASAASGMETGTDAGTDADADADADAEGGPDGAGTEPETSDEGSPAGGGHRTLALEVADDLDADTIVLVDADDPAALTAAATTAARTGDAVVPVDADDDVAAVLDDHEGRTVTTVGEIADRLPAGTEADAAADPWDTGAGSDVVWLLDPTDAAGPAVAVAAARNEHAVAPVDGGDLRQGRAEVQRVREAVEAGAQATLVGAIADPDQLPVLLEAPEVPGGGLVHLEETRMVALYGRPATPSLGALGEQDLDATIARAREVSEGYDADGRDTVPTLEVIVTVASVDPQADESYSSVTAPEEFEELVERAGEEGVQVVLDLQPGRTDFLTQAQIYEELLREPHVGLALDPEWRLEDDQVHLVQIGGVEAEEVQEVVDWYAELTRDEGLAESLLVLHQFRMDMLPDRDTIEIPQEIAAVVHADGQGPQEMKLETWRVMTAGAGGQWLWGWKNFYDEDPVVATPAEVLDLDPNVVFVTYQ